MRGPAPGVIVAICAGAALACYAVWKIAIALRSDETRVRIALEDIANSARDRDVGALLEYIDPEYRDAVGYTRREVEAGLRYLLGRAKAVEVDLAVLSIRVEGDRAFAIVRARAELRAGGALVRLADAGFDGDTFEVELRRCGSYFRVLSVRAAGEGQLPRTHTSVPGARAQGA